MSESAGPLVEVSLAPPVATLTLNRPHRHNSLVPSLLTALIDAAIAVAGDSEIRSVVLAANGRSFSTGGDVGAFYDHRDRLASYADEIVGLLNESMLTLMRLPQPVIAAVHGPVTGGSLGLVLASDVVVASPSASFTPWYSVVGFAPDGGWTAILPDRIGAVATTDVLLRNRTIDAEEAVSLGLATEVADDDAFDDRVAELAVMLSAGKTAAIKRSLNADLDDTARRLDIERRLFVEQVGTPESVRGMAAFLGVD